MLRGLVKSCRPQQWIKNGLLLGGFVFAGRLRQPLEVSIHDGLKVLAAILCFCAIASATYLVNDILDLEQDRAHPTKRHRPIAAGVVPLAVAGFTAALLYCIGIGFAVVVTRASHSVGFAVSAVAYVALTFSYSLVFKHYVILDVLLLALGFVIRVMAGCLALPVLISPWIILCTLLLALFIGLCKRRHELLLMQSSSAESRRVLPKYSEALLDQMISVALSTTLMAYCLYTVLARHAPALGGESPLMMLTIPFVIYGLFRYLYLAYRKDFGGSPELMFGDKPLALNMLLWALTVAALTVLGRH